MEAKRIFCLNNGEGATKDFFIFWSWFDSTSSSEYGMHVGATLIDALKTTTGVVYKYTTQNLTYDRIVCSYFMLNKKPMLPDNSPLIDIGYKYNSRKVLSLIETEGSIWPVVCSHIMSKFFWYIKTADPHNKTRQSD